MTGGREATGGHIPGRWAISVGEPTAPPTPGFRWAALTTLARLESGHTPSRRVPGYWDGDIPWIGIRDATENHGLVLDDTAQHVTEDGIANSSARVLPTGTVCLSRTASVGYVVMMGRPMATSQDFVNWVCGPDLEPHYLKYILLAEQDSIRRFAHGTTHQTMYYPEAKALHVCIPDVDHQRRALAVLKGLDDLIDTNRELADAAGGCWRAVVTRAAEGGRLPLSKLATFMNGRNFTKGAGGSGRPVIRTPEVREGPRQGTIRSNVAVGSEYLARPGDILFVWSGTLLVNRWRHEEGLVNQHVFKVSPASGVPAWLVLFAIESQLPWFRSLAADKATTMGHIQRAHLDEVVSVPEPGSWAALGAQVQPMFDLELSLAMENERLLRTRDELLPLLLSGRIHPWQVAP